MTAAGWRRAALACALVLGACAHPPAPRVLRSQIRKSGEWTKVCTLEMVDAEVAAGAPVRLRFTLFNHDFYNSFPRTPHLTIFTAVDTPLAGLRADLFDVERDGQPVPYHGEVAKTPEFDRCATPSGCALVEGDYLRIGSEEKLSAEVDLAAAYAFDRPGTYTIRYKVRLHDVRVPVFRPLLVFTYANGPTPHRRVLSPADPQCNTVTVTVRPR